MGPRDGRPARDGRRLVPGEVEGEEAGTPPRGPSRSGPPPSTDRCPAPPIGSDHDRAHQPPRRVRRRLGPQRHQHDGRHPAHPGPARAPAGGGRRRDQPQGVRRAALGGRPPHRAARPQQRAGLRRPAPRLARHRHHQRRPRHPRARRRLARGAARRRRRARHQGPPRGLVPRPVARGRRPLRRHVVVRHDAAAGHRGRRLQADLLRPDGRRLRPGRRHPHRRLDQHDAPHRAGHARPAAGVRPLRRPARGLDAAGVRARARPSTSPR